MIRKATVEDAGRIMVVLSDPEVVDNMLISFPRMPTRDEVAASISSEFAYWTVPTDESVYGVWYFQRLTGETWSSHVATAKSARKQASTLCRAAITLLLKDNPETLRLEGRVPQSNRLAIAHAQGVGFRAEHVAVCTHRLPGGKFGNEVILGLYACKFDRLEEEDG
jgi:hypothetical protein